MNYIWYNSEMQTYQLGSSLDLKINRANSKQPDDFVVLYELADVERRIAEKIVMELNAARKEERTVLK